MNAIVLEEQKDFFETTVLEQSGTVKFLSCEDAVAKADAPCFVIGNKGLDDYKRTLLALCKTFYKKGFPVILVNPPIELDIGACIGAPSPIYIRKRKAASVCRYKEQALSEVKNCAEIWSDGVIETSLSSGIECVDEENKCILLRFQPKNTTGSVFITTLKILSYSAMTTETDRERVINYILLWKNSDVPVVSKKPIKSVLQLESHIIIAVAVLIFAFNRFDKAKIIETIPLFFDFDIDETTAQQAFEILKKDVKIESQETIATELENYLDRLGFYSYAREIKEIIQEQEAAI